MVEIHYYAFILYFIYGSVEAVAFGICHGKYVSNLKQSLFDFTVDLEYLFGQFYYGIPAHLSVCIGSVKHEIKEISNLFLLYVLFEFGKQIPCSVNELHGFLGCNRFYHITVHSKGI